MCADFRSLSTELSSVALYFQRLCEAHFELYGQFCPATLVKCDDDGEKIEAIGATVKMLNPRRCGCKTCMQ